MLDKDIPNQRRLCDAKRTEFREDPDEEKLDRNRLFFRYDIEKKARDVESFINSDVFIEGVKKVPIVSDPKIKSLKDEVYRVIKDIRSNSKSINRVSLD